jgi:phenol 2-monooxygenase
MRFHSAPVIRVADAKPVHLGHVVKADGRFRIFAFAGADDTGAKGSPMRALCDFLSGPQSPVTKYTPAGADMDAVIDVRAVFQQEHHQLAIETMPSLLLPQKGRFGLHDYEKIFAPDLKSGNDIFAMRGIDRQKGCVVIVRPDQFVAHVLPLDGFEQIARYFDGFMIEGASAAATKAA